MVDEVRYVSIREILSRVARHPMLQDVDLEAAIQYTLDFFGIVGMPELYEDKLAVVPIHNFKGELPCDIVRIHQVRDEHTKHILRKMTDNFNTASRFTPGGDSFKTQNRVIFTSFPEGKVLISYQAIHTDADGLPMLPEDSPFLIALEAYIKNERFQILYDQGKLKKDIYDNTKQSYMFAKNRVINRYRVPSESEMQTITGLMHRMIPSTNEFQNGFKGLGDSEHYKVRKSFRR